MLNDTVWKTYQWKFWLRDYWFKKLKYDVASAGNKNLNYSLVTSGNSEFRPWCFLRSSETNIYFFPPEQHQAITSVSRTECFVCEVETEFVSVLSNIFSEGLYKP